MVASAYRVGLAIGIAIVGVLEKSPCLHLRDIQRPLKGYIRPCYVSPLKG